MNENIRILIGFRLREERDRLGFSQQAFADLGSASMRAEQDWERGVSAPKADFLAVAATHGVDVLYVLTGTRSVPVESTLSPDERALLDNYRHASPGRQASLRDVSAALASASHEKRTGNGD